MGTVKAFGILEGVRCVVRSGDRGRAVFLAGVLERTGVGKVDLEAYRRIVQDKLHFANLVHRRHLRVVDVRAPVPIYVCDQDFRDRKCKGVPINVRLCNIERW